MRYYKCVKNNITLCVGIGFGYEEITKSEYERIMLMMANKPTARDGYDYRLTSLLEWEEYQITQDSDES